MNTVFEMASPGSGVSWLFGIVTLIFVVLLGLFLFLWWSTTHVQFTIADDTLVLKGDLWGRTIPFGELDREAAHRVDWNEEPGLRPKRRTMGTGMPGYVSGWFKLQDGQKALLYLTDRSRAVFIPTTRGYGVLLSPKDPPAFLAALREG